MHETAMKNAAPGFDGFNFKKLAARVIKYWYWYLLGLVLTLFIAFLYIRYATPMYTVYAKVLVKDDKSGGGSLSSSGGSNENFNPFFNSTSNLNNELAILQTIDLSSKVVDAMQLYKTYYYRGRVKDIEVYNDLPFTVSYKPYNPQNIIPIFLDIDFNSGISNRFKVTVGDSSFTTQFNDTFYLAQAAFCFTKTGSFTPKGNYLFTISNPRDIASAVAGNISSSIEDKTSVIDLYYNTSIPTKGLDVLNQLIKSYVDRNLDEKNQLSDSTISFINSRIALVGSDLGAIESNIQTFKQQNKLADLQVQSNQLISNSSNYNQQLTTLSVQLQVVQSMLDYLEDDKNNNRPVPALLNNDPTFQSLTENYNSLQMQRDKLLLSIKVNNSIVQNLDSQIANIRASMVRSLKSQQHALTINQQQVMALSGQNNASIHSVPVQERKSMDLSRQQDVEQALYLFLLQKKEETAVAKAANLPNVSIIEYPKFYPQPYSPNTTRIFTIAALLGIVIPFSIIQLRYAFNNKVISREDISNGTPVPVLAEIGRGLSKKFFSEEADSVLMEQLRILRTNLKFITSVKGCPVILLTSAMKGEGKSFVAAHLGQIYAISGKKVLLMELDLRQPTLLKDLGIKTNSGFSDYAISNEPVQRFIQTLPGVSNYYILPAGTIPSNPAELLLSTKFQMMMQELKKQFDVIIIDTPPVGAVTDAQILGDYSDVSLYIIRQNYTVKDSLKVVNDVVENQKLPNVCLIVNDVKEHTSSYKYGYNFSNFENKRKRKNGILSIKRS